VAEAAARGQAATGGPQPLDAATLWQLARLGAPSISPDGGAAVASLTRFDAEPNTGQTQLWRLATDGSPPRPLTTMGDKDGQPAWSPRGDLVAFVARRRQADGALDATPQLYAIAADGGEARRLAHFAPGVESFRWLPDGRRIVFAAWSFARAPSAAAQARAWRARQEAGTRSVATEQAFHRYWDQELPPDQRLQLWLLHVGRGRIAPLTAGTRFELPRSNDGHHSYAVHPKGRRLCFVHDPAREPRLGQPQALAEIDLASRRIRTLSRAPGWDLEAPAYSPDGRQLACLAAETGRDHTALARPALVRRDGRLRPLTPAWDRAVDAPLRWQPNGRALFFAAEDRGRRHLWRLPLRARARAAEDAAAPERWHAGGWVHAFDLAAGHCVLLADSAAHPARWLARPLKSDGDAGGQALRLERFNDELLARCSLGPTHEVEVPGALGEPIQLWITHPPGSSADSRTPQAVVQVIHGGPFAAAGDSFGWRWNAHVLAAPAAPGQAGRVIVQTNYHGSSGFGHAFRASIMGRQGALELQDLVAATDWVCRQPWADPQRLAAAGGSYGGFLVAWMNGHLPPWPAGRFRAYVCHAGVFDRVSTFSADSWPVRPKDLAAEYWRDLPRVLAQSPHAFAAHMATPTLVIHGARDYRVPDANGLAYYNTLKARGVPARLLWFADENHWVLKPANALQWHREWLAWIDAHTAPVPAAAGPQP